MANLNQNVETNNVGKFIKPLVVVMYRQYGTPKRENGTIAGISALQASLLRGKELVKL